MKISIGFLTLLALILPATAAAQHPARGCPSTDSAMPAGMPAMHSRMHGAGCGAQDSAFAAMQTRGKKVMGVDLYTSTHHFDSLADGGRIVLQRDAVDPAGTRVIREHLRHIAMAFARGDFSLPMQVHARVVPGTKVMTARRDGITYTYGALPRGGEVRIRSKDPAAIRAIHEFLAFQRRDHHAGGTVMSRP